MPTARPARGQEAWKPTRRAASNLQRLWGYPLDNIAQIRGHRRWRRRCGRLAPPPDASPVRTAMARPGEELWRSSRRTPPRARSPGAAGPGPLAATAATPHCRRSAYRPTGCRARVSQHTKLFMPFVSHPDLGHPADEGENSVFRAGLMPE